jgi:hypothetical protein
MGCVVFGTDKPLFDIIVHNCNDCNYLRVVEWNNSRNSAVRCRECTPVPVAMLSTIGMWSVMSVILTRGTQDGCVVAEGTLKCGSMYTLIHGLYKYFLQKDEFCVLILGLDNAGKTVSGSSVLSFVCT